MSLVSPLQTFRTNASNATAGRSALIKLWNDAVERYREKHSDNTAIESIVSDIRGCDKPELILAVIESHTHQFEAFRKAGGKFKDILRTITRVLLSFSDAAADMAADGLPGGKFIVVAVTSLLKLSGSVSALYDTIETVLREIGQALARLEGYFKPSTPISAQLSLIFLESLVLMLEILSIVEEHCKMGMKKSGHARFFGAASRRAVDYGHLLKGDTKLQDKIKRLQWLTNQQSLQTAMETHVYVRKIHQELFESKQEEEYWRIQQWVNPVDTSDLHVTQLARRRGTTCDWILNDDGFTRWKETKNSVYTILGHAGSGKSVLCSVIVEHLKAIVRAMPGFALAYFHFTMTSRSDITNSHRSLITSLTFQIASSSAPCWKLMQNEYAALSRTGSPTNDELLDLLRRLLQVAEVSFIVIDALDECQLHDSRNVDEQSATLEFLVHLHSLGCPNLHLLVTSRPESQIQDYLNRLPSRIPLDLQYHTKHEGDLRAYIEARLSEFAFAGWGDSLRDEAMRKLSNMEKSHGMFLWVSLQLRALQHCTADEVPVALESLPRGLTGTFRGILDRFDSVCSPASVPRVVAILGLIAVAKRPLRVQEVVAAFAFDFTRGQVKRADADPKPTDAKAFILQHLPALIEVRFNKHEDEDTATVHFIHFSVKEYLINSASPSTPDSPGPYLLRPPDADLHLATLSLVTLHQHTSLRGFLPYADEWWFDHVQLAVNNGQLDFLDHPGSEARCAEAVNLTRSLISFLEYLAEQWETPSPSFVRRARASSFDIHATTHATLSWPSPRHYFLPPLHIAAELGSIELLERQLMRDCDADKTGKLPITGEMLPAVPFLQRADFSALFWTILHTDRKAHLRIIDALLDRGAAQTFDARTAWSYENLMQLAMHAPNADLVVSHLVARGMDIDVRDSNGQTPLHRAATWMKGSSFRGRTLLTHGADPNAVDNQGRSPLGLAAKWSRELTAALLEKGARPDFCVPGDFTTLQWAAIRGLLDIVNILLERGANAEALTELEELGVHVLRVNREATGGIQKRLRKLERMRRLRHADGLPPLSLSEQRELLHPPPELVELPRERAYGRAKWELEHDDPDLVRYWGPN